MQWPTLLLNVFSAFEAVSSTAGSVITPDCIINDLNRPAYARALAVAATPLVAVLSIVAIFAVSVPVFPSVTTKRAKQHAVVAIIVVSFALHLRQVMLKRSQDAACNVSNAYVLLTN